ncbi:uncharacterized protein LOC135087791 isoform X1 [Ostrinia nubilalis]|uniref:uncharacterized protein LOC135087791 isoform X1 n=1 Tax=Ostrinia nubilalis TaxID=29057 RepID=UPI003082515E
MRHENKGHRHRAQNVQPVMGQLPLNRTQLDFPFQNCNVDYAGPVLIADRKGRGYQDEMVGIHRRGQAWTAGAHQGEDPATALVTRAGREDLSRRGWHHQGGRVEDKEGDHTSSLQLHLPASTSLKKMTLQPGEYVGASRVLGLLRHRSAIIVSARGAGTLRTCPTPTQPHDRHRCQTRPSHVGAN